MGLFLLLCIEGYGLLQQGASWEGLFLGTVSPSHTSAFSLLTLTSLRPHESDLITPCECGMGTSSEDPTHHDVDNLLCI